MWYNQRWKKVSNKTMNKNAKRKQSLTTTTKKNNNNNLSTRLFIFQRCLVAK
jgi:hypothetical protein